MNLIFSFISKGNHPYIYVDMENHTYSVLQIDTHIFEFLSAGKKPIIKRILFTEMDTPGFYNLALGSIIRNGIIDYRDESNNGDIIRIFSTIVICIKIFTERFPECIIFFKGNTEQKTRVYNEILRKYYIDFLTEFAIFGVSITDENITTAEEFSVSKTYSGFLVKRKTK